MEEFVGSNIEEINSGINAFPNKSEIRNYLEQKFLDEVIEKEEELIEKFKEFNYVRARIVDIANQFIYYKKDLEKFFDSYLFHHLLQDIETDELFKGMEVKVREKVDRSAYHFIRNDFRKLSEKFIYLIKQGGFQTNLEGLNAGVMVANSGDSAQFLFLSRAILAGYNCSNVDVRSSRYDAIIDFQGTLLKVQVKGISYNSISFKDRDRGGQGIDYTHEGNRGKVITAEDCDIYVAVDKQSGICYIIPMYEVDQLPEDQKTKSVNIKEFGLYRENWDVIRLVTEYKQNI